MGAVQIDAENLEGIGAARLIGLKSDWQALCFLQKPTTDVIVIVIVIIVRAAMSGLAVVLGFHDLSLIYGAHGAPKRI